MTLAAATPDPSTAWNVVLTIGVLLSIGLTAVTLFRTGKAQPRCIEPQPLKVELAKEFPTRPEFERLDHDMREIRMDFKALNTKLDVINHDNEKRSSRLHERIDNLPSDIIATLRNTGNLRA